MNKAKCGNDANKASLSVLIARPEKKGRALAERLNKVNINATVCSLFRYQIVDNTPLCKSLLTSIGNKKLVFVSVAAIEFAHEIVSAEFWCYDHVFAIGQATQTKLRSLGIKALSPEQQDSEGLLQIKELEQISGDNILIVRGDAGRELLFDTLQRRGAHVSYAQSYQRVWQTPSSSMVKEWYQEGINCIVVTSVAILENMLNLLISGNDLSSDNHWQKSCCWVVASERIANRAKSLGLTHIINAHSADNQRLLDTIIELEKNNG